MVTNAAQHVCLTSEIRRRAASAALAFAAMLVPAVFATRSAQAQTYTESVLYNFAGGMDGAAPMAGLVRDSAGNLYGTTFEGGARACLAGCGTVFKVAATGQETVLYKFAGTPDGSGPVSGLVRDTAGNLYGTTSTGGSSGGSLGYGTVFKVATTGIESVLYDFGGSPDGLLPYCTLIRDASGNLYGTTFGGGSNSLGTVFKLTSTGTESVLHSFTGQPDGASPYSGLVRDTAGNLYGNTAEGGDTSCTGGCGTVFKVTSAGAENVLYTFTGKTDGANPGSVLVRDSAGNLYGTAYYGANAACVGGCGVAFKVETNGHEVVMHTFTGMPDGGNPNGSLVRDSAGNLYGTTVIGGAFNFGTVFELSKTGKETVLYSFTGQPDGANPVAGLVRDTAGNLYGTTNGGGASGHGTVFELKP